MTNLVKSTQLTDVVTLATDQTIAGNKSFTPAITITGGLKDTNVTTAIALGSSLNTSFQTTNKSIVGAVNELETYISNVSDTVSANNSAALHKAGTETASGAKSFTLATTLTGGVKDANVTTAINIGDASNTSFITNNKTIVGSVNETETDCINIRQDIGQLTSGTNSFYLDYSEILTIDTENSIEMRSLTNSPDGASEATYNIELNSSISPHLIEVYKYNTSLNSLALERGVSAIKAWAGVNALTGTTELVANFRRVYVLTDITLTMTGTGTSRTATASSIIFIPADADASPTDATFIETPKGLYQITGYTSGAVVTIETPAGYVNESAVAFSKHMSLFDISTGNIPTTTVQEITGFSIVNTAKTFLVADKLSIFMFAKTSSVTNVTIDYRFNGQTRYTHIELPPFREIYSYMDAAPVGNIGGGRLAQVVAASDDIYFNITQPRDAVNILSRTILCFPDVGGSGAGKNIDLRSQYTVSIVNGATDEYVETNTTSTYTLTFGEINRIPIAALFSSSGPGMNGTVRLTTNAIGGNLYVLGIETTYYK